MESTTSKSVTITAPREILHTILVCEPSTYAGNYMPGWDSLPVRVTEDMYRSILHGPVEALSNKECGSNAYFFGSVMPFEKYTFFTSHDNDAGQTGFIDLDLAPIVDQSLWDGDRRDELWGWSWLDDEESLAIKFSDRPWLAVHEKNVAVLWSGDTNMGDLGADLYIHMDQDTGHIDSLLINHYYFDDPNRHDEDCEGSGGEEAAEGEGKEEEDV